MLDGRCFADKEIGVCQRLKLDYLPLKTVAFYYISRYLLPTYIVLVNENKSGPPAGSSNTIFSLICKVIVKVSWLKDNIEG